MNKANKEKAWLTRKRKCLWLRVKNYSSDGCYLMYHTSVKHTPTLPAFPQSAFVQEANIVPAYLGRE